jgi:hypothetical protein
MENLTGLQRLLTTIKLQEPDMVPTFEIHIDSKVREKIGPGLSYEDFIEFMDLDAIVFTELGNDKYNVLDETQGLVQDKWGAIKRFTIGSEMVSVFVEAPIKSEKDFKDYVPPDPDSFPGYYVLEQYVKRFKGEKAVIACLIDPFLAIRDSLFGEIAYFKAVNLSLPILPLRLGRCYPLKTRNGSLCPITRR